MGSALSFFALCPRYAEDLLAAELQALGASSVREHPAGVGFSGTLETGYRACLWSRVATRVLLPLAEFAATTPEQVREGAKRIDWQQHMDLDSTFAVSCTMADSPIRHSHYGALLVKDGVADWFRERTFKRPSVDTEHPAVRLHVHLSRARAAISLDLSGESLHRRGYRTAQGAAPLKENAAAAVLLRAGWPAIAEAGGSFLDPMCGSGTLVIEAALMALDAAPGLTHSGFGLLGWKGHDAALWKRLVDEAWKRRRRSAGVALLGCDADAAVIARAKANSLAAGLAGVAHFQTRRLSECVPPDGQPGLVAVNPPYGHRLGDDRPPPRSRPGDRRPPGRPPRRPQPAPERLQPLYASLGRVLRERFSGWRLALLTAEPRLAQATGLRPVRSHRLYNGPIPCEVTQYVIGEDAPLEQPVVPAAQHAPAPTPAPPPPLRPATQSRDDQDDAPPPPSPYAVRKAARGMVERSDEEIAAEEKETLANRLQKNLRRLKTWAREEQVRCFRVYDADLPQYAVAVDFYEDKWAHVQEYAPPALVDEERAARRLRDVAEAVPAALGIPADSVFIKERRKQKGREQYERLDDRGVRHEVREGGLRFLVNFTDYLDTGLFLDHRVTRRMISDLAPGRVFLNLFCYTASASVYAAWGGALRTVSVDTSNTYLTWAQQNLELNGFTGERHRTVRADARDFLASDKGRYGLVFIDPPTFSNSKGDRENFSVQRDHAELVRSAVDHLERDGIVVFSNNFRKFKLDEEGLEGLEIDDVSKRTIPRDFARNGRIHRCWVITRRREEPRRRRR